MIRETANGWRRQRGKWTECATARGEAVRHCRCREVALVHKLNWSRTVPFSSCEVPSPREADAPVRSLGRNYSLPNSRISDIASEISRCRDDAVASIPPATTLLITSRKDVDGRPPAFAGACFAYHDAGGSAADIMLLYRPWDRVRGRP